MEALTPASADDLPPLGELVVDDPFWRHPAWGLAREGVAHLRIWATVADPPGYVAVVTETGLETRSLSRPGGSGPSWSAGTARRWSCSSTIWRPSSARAWRPWIWSASAQMAARTGPASGRPRRTIPVTAGWSCGWRLMDTRSSAGPRASSIGVKARTLLLTGDLFGEVTRYKGRVGGPRGTAVPLVPKEVLNGPDGRSVGPLWDWAVSAGCFPSEVVGDGVLTLINWISSNRTNTSAF